MFRLSVFKEMVKQKRMLFIVGVIFLICIFIGITFAYWQFTLRQTNTNIVTTDCFNITFTGNNDINLQKAYPITDNEGASLSPYTFTIENWIVNTFLDNFYKDNPKRYATGVW